MDTATTAHGSTIEQARGLADKGDHLAAIEVLESALRRSRDDATEILLAAYRHAAFDEVVPASKYESWPVPAPDLDPTEQPQVPIVAPSELTVASLRRAIRGHGSVLVPGLFDSERVEQMVSGIQQALAVRTAQVDSPTSQSSSWFAGLRLPQEKAQSLGRPWIAGAGGVLACDSPRMLQAVLAAYEDVGLRELLTGYLGERPILSANKCTLREVPITAKTDWHQDGAFIGTGVRALNVWVALTDCGTTAPGMDLVQRRFETIQETGTGGAIFDWAVGPDVVAALSSDHPVVRPEFAAGDALLFDDLYLHRTGISADMVNTRYAIESWFFAATDYPEGQVPLVW